VPFFHNLKPTAKYSFFLLAIWVAVCGAMFGSFAAMWQTLSAEEKAFMSGLIDKMIPFQVLGTLILFGIIGGLVSMLFRYYVIPTLRLGEQTRLITVVNPGYRIRPDGAQELQQLARIINQSAEAFEQLQSQIDEQIRSAKQELKDERNRLAALMSDLPQGVLVCNASGQVLLYNSQAQKLLQRPEHHLGLGRSIFGLIERDPLIHAIDVLNHAVQEGKKQAQTSFMLTPHDNLNLRAQMMPFFRDHEGRQDINGYVLTLDDITEELEADLRLDLLLRTLSEAMRFSSQEIRESITTILNTPDIPPKELDDLRQTIDRASLALSHQIEDASLDLAQEITHPANKEDISGQSLATLVARQLGRQTGLDISTQVEDDLWLRLDSYTLVQGLTRLGSQIQDRALPSRQLLVRIAPSDELHARLEIAWAGTVDQEILSFWREQAAREAESDADASFDTLLKETGSSCALPGNNLLCLQLPTVATEETSEIYPQIEQRPLYFEFDLFNPQSWQELGQIPLRKLTFVVFDTETTGLYPSEGDEIIQIGAIRMVNGRILHDETIDQLVDPQRYVPPTSVEVHGIQPELLIGQPTIAEVLPTFHRFCEGSVLVAHNAAFDMKFLQLQEEATGLRFDHPVLDTLLLSWIVHPNQDGHSLDKIAQRFDIPIIGRHTALGDSIVTAEVLVRLIPLLEDAGIHTLEEAIQASASSPLAKLKY